MRARRGSASPTATAQAALQDAYRASYRHRDGVRTAGRVLNEGREVGRRWWSARTGGRSRVALMHPLRNCSRSAHSHTLLARASEASAPRGNRSTPKILLLREVRSKPERPCCTSRRAGPNPTLSVRPHRPSTADAPVRSPRRPRARVGHVLLLALAEERRLDLLLGARACQQCPTCAEVGTGRTWWVRHKKSM